MTREGANFTSKELSSETWPDLERLFTKPGIGDARWCWCTFHHRTHLSSEDAPHTRAERAVVNRRDKRTLVEEGRTHGVLIYATDGEPVGWCQYGPREELPRLDHSRNYRSITSQVSNRPFWRITCFVVDKSHRKQGVATAALKAALEAIRKKGGGIVEAYPVTKTDQGPGYMYTGRVSTFERTGFKKVAPLSTGRTSTVVMRVTI